MVSYKDVLSNNNSLKTTTSSGLVAVFVGATNGIGQAALRSFTKKTSSPTIYIVGRSSSRLNTLINSLQPTNSSATLVPILTNDLTLLKDSAAAANEIASKAKRIDLLFMSQGYLSTVRRESPEGLDRCIALRHYSRMQFLQTLAPALRAAANPRVISVLAGGQEGALYTDDWQLEKNYGLVNMATHTGTIHTLTLEEFRKQPGNEKIVLVHIYPGFVGGTGIVIDGLSWWMQLLADWIATPILRLVGYSAEEAGERVVYAATSGRFRKFEAGSATEGTGVERGSDGRVGSGVYLVHQDSSVVSENDALKKLHQEGKGEVAWRHTMDVLDTVGRRS